MTLRCALYARYSSDQQRPASIEDQFRVCRERAEREGWKIVGTYKDSAISGDSVILRPGVQALVEDARRGVFEVLVAEGLDRISRDQADVATLYKHMQFAGVPIFTLSEGGEVNELHVGLKGTMNALFLKDLAAKTHRGLRGRVEAGKSSGGLCYGYDVVKAYDAAGEPVRGERRINEAEAEVVRRILREFANGASPRGIARRLNEEGVPGPRGKVWTDAALRGHAKRGRGIVNNELYIGRQVWNRQRFVKNPETGRRVPRLNPPEEWIVTEVPELRIVDDGLWQAVKARQAELSEIYADTIASVREAHANRLNRTHRPRYLLSGLLKCGVCGSPFAMRGQSRYICSRHMKSLSCSNTRGIQRSVIEERVLVGLKDRLLAPEAVARAMKAYAEETNRLNHERRASGATDRAELADIEKRMASMIAAIEEGGYVRGMSDRLRELEARQDELNERLAAVPADLPDIHPNIAGIYRRKVERLAEALANPRDRDEAADAIRGLIERIELTPGERRGEMHATLQGDLGTILEWAGADSGGKASGSPNRGMSVSVLAGAGFGKSNLNKLLFSMLYETTPTVEKRGGREVPVGTVIFDPDGEYFWPDDKGRPGLCDVPHLQDKLVVFTPRSAPSGYYGSFVAGGVKLDIRQLPPGDVISIALPPGRQDQQNVAKLRALSGERWVRLVDLIDREKGGADPNEIGEILNLTMPSQEVEAIAARSNMTRVVGMLHDRSSQFMGLLMRALEAGKICVVDVSQMRGEQSFILGGIVLRRIFDRNQEEFTKAEPRTVPTIAVIEEAQSVLNDRSTAAEPYVSWVKEGPQIRSGRAADNPAAGLDPERDTEPGRQLVRFPPSFRRRPRKRETGECAFQRRPPQLSAERADTGPGRVLELGRRQAVSGVHARPPVRGTLQPCRSRPFPRSGPDIRREAAEGRRNPCPAGQIGWQGKGRGRRTAGRQYAGDRR